MLLDSENTHGMISVLFQIRDLEHTL